MSIFEAELIIEGKAGVADPEGEVIERDLIHKSGYSEITNLKGVAAQLLIITTCIAQGKHPILSGNKVKVPTISPQQILRGQCFLWGTNPKYFSVEQHHPVEPFRGEI